MKVEVGESIVYSWLRHIKRCEVVQLNWKTSPKWDARHDVGFLQRAMDKANEEFNGLFKKTKTVEQLLKQAEIDAMGVNIREHEIHAVDVAFHENGLDYGDKLETGLRVAKKYLRTIFVLESYFEKEWNPSVYFVSPKITPSTYECVQARIAELRRFLDREGLLSRLSLIANSDFYSKILGPISAISGDLSDTSELFLRSMQLIKAFRKNKNTM